MTKTMKNGEIYSIASAVLTEIKEDLNLPVKVKFCLQKNISEIVNLAKEIEEARNTVLSKYGTIDEENQQYTFESQEIVDKVNIEITELLDVDQEVKVKMIPLSWFGDAELTAAQVSAISFMIDDEED